MEMLESSEDLLHHERNDAFLDFGTPEDVSPHVKHISETPDVHEFEDQFDVAFFVVSTVQLHQLRTHLQCLCWVAYQHLQIVEQLGSFLLVQDVDSLHSHRVIRWQVYSFVHPRRCATSEKPSYLDVTGLDCVEHQRNLGACRYLGDVPLGIQTDVGLIEHYSLWTPIIRTSQHI